jgi:hypothetical protein
MGTLKVVSHTPKRIPESKYESIKVSKKKEGINPSFIV